MNADTVIVGEPMSTIPTSPSKPSNLSFSSTSRPSTPISTYTFPQPLTPDALKANPHPYPIRTTSTGILSRSNSTASTVTTAHPHQYQYQYYVPQSPKESASGKDTVTRRHRYSKSLVNLDSGPKPLPTTTFSHRNRSMSSSESDSPTKSEEEEEENDEEEDLATGKKKKRGRRAACRGGKVRGIVASFEGRSDPEDVRRGQYDYKRKRTESDASSVSSASSFGSFTDVKAEQPAEANTCTPKRNNVEKQGREEPTMEELLASGVDPTVAAVYDETVKLHSADVAYSTVTASSIRYSLPIPTFSGPFWGTPKSSPLVHPNPNPNPTDADDELSVEELLALVSNSSTGASAWERDDVGCCTVKRVGGQKKLGQDSADGSSMSHPRQVSPTGPVSEREQGLVQEMSETREMVRALSARVASVEAKIGEMEIVAGELEVRGRQLLVEDDGDDDDEDSKPPQGQSLPVKVASTLYRTVFGVGASLVRMVLPFSSSSSRKSRSRETAVLPMWYKRSWASYLLFLGLGACAFVLREVVRRGMMLRGRRT